MSEQELAAFFDRMKTENLKDHENYLDKVSDFLAILGYEASSLYFDRLLSAYNGRRADIVVASSRTARPWILVEVKSTGHMRLDHGFWSSEIDQLRALANPEYAVLFAPPTTLAIYYGHHPNPDWELFDFRGISTDKVAHIYKMLRKPKSLPTEPPLLINEEPQVTSPEASHFAIDLQQCRDLWR